jgi:hypothetical protein
VPCFTIRISPLSSGISSEDLKELRARIVRAVLHGVDNKTLHDTVTCVDLLERLARVTSAAAA